MTEEENTPRLINEPDDLVTGFEPLEPKLLESRAPKLKFTPAWDERSTDRKIEYLMKLAATMNHAAKLIQDERDALVKLMEKKEQQLEKMSAAMEANNEMLQTQVMKMNEQRQGYHAEVKRLGDQVRSLEAGQAN